jgi:hypothetical protein
MILNYIKKKTYLDKIVSNFDKPKTQQPVKKKLLLPLTSTIHMTLPKSLTRKRNLNMLLLSQNYNLKSKHLRLTTKPQTNPIKIFYYFTTTSYKVRESV